MQEILTKLGLEDIPPVKVPKDLSQAIEEFMRSNKRFLVIFGPTGTFKTSAVKQFLYAYAKDKLLKYGEVSVYDCMFVRFVDLPKVWHEDEEVLYRTKLLAIDDLVFSGLSDDFWLKLFSLIDYRYTKPFKTIITTTHDLKRLLEGEVSFQQKIAARLCDENLSMLVMSSAS
jgi:DNA replication protein DnaC